MFRIVIVLSLLFIVGCSDFAHAQSTDPLQVSQDFSQRMVQIFQGPISKILAAIVLLAGVGGLLRGRHKIAISCAAAFILILFLPILLQQVGGH